MIYLAATITIALGAFALCRGAAIHDFLLRHSSGWNRRVLLVRGYVGILRLVGAGWIAFGVFIIIVHLTSQK